MLNVLFLCVLFAARAEISEQRIENIATSARSHVFFPSLLSRDKNNVTRRKKKEEEQPLNLKRSGQGKKSVGKKSRARLFKFQLRFGKRDRDRDRDRDRQREKKKERTNRTFYLVQNRERCACAFVSLESSRSRAATRFGMEIFNTQTVVLFFFFFLKRRRRDEIGKKSTQTGALRSRERITQQ
jgi:hypothetical protein